MKVVIKSFNKVKNPESKVKAMVDISLDGQIAIKGIRVVLDNKGDCFISYPDTKFKDKYVPYIIIEDCALAQEIENTILIYASKVL